MSESKLEKLKDKKIALVMPPAPSYGENFSWLDYPSLIFIENHLRKNGLKSNMIDLHFKFIMRMLNDKSIKEDANRTKAEMKELLKEKNLLKDKIEYYLHIFHHLNWLKKVNKEMDLNGVKNIYELAQKNPFLKDNSLYFLISDYDIFRKKHGLNNDRHFLEGIEEEFIKWLEKALEEIIEDKNLVKYDFIGITVPSLVHFPYAMLLSRLIKQKSDCVIVMGGPAIILTADEELKALQQKGFFDEFVKLGGEKQFLKILKERSDIEVDDKESSDLSTNINEQVLMYPTETQIKKKEAKLSINFGCYWNKCSFCDFCNLYDKFQIKKVDILIDEMEHLNKEYGMDSFMLNTESLVPEYAKKLSLKIIKRGLKIKWHPIFMRVDKKFTIEIFKTMKKSGCELSKTSIGVESFCNEALEFLNKPYKKEDIVLFFETARKAGLVFGQLNMIIDTPGTTLVESYEGVKIMKEYIDVLSDYACSRLHLTASSPICKDYKQNLITPIYEMEKNEEDYSKRFNFLNHCELYCNRISFKNSATIDKEMFKKLEMEYEKLYDYLHLFMHHPKLDRHKMIDFMDNKNMSFDLKLKMFDNMEILGSIKKSGDKHNQGFIVPKIDFFVTGSFLRGHKYIKHMKAGETHKFSEIIKHNIEEGVIDDNTQGVSNMIDFFAHLLSRHYFEDAEIIPL